MPRTHLRPLTGTAPRLHEAHDDERRAGTTAGSRSRGTRRSTLPFGAGAGAHELEDRDASRSRRSSSMPMTSLIAVTLRVPSERRALLHDDVDARRRSARGWRACGSSTPAMRTSVSRRAMASRGEFACVVVSEPSWPVFIAWSMSSASPPRHSPTTMRSGRMRSAFFTRSRIVYSPRPSRFGGARLERDDVRLLELELGGVLDGDDALVGRDGAREHVEQRRLAGAGAAGDDDVLLRDARSA